MKNSLTYILLFLSISILAQNKHDFVSIKETIKGKRIELFAVNTHQTQSFDVFLMVESTDLRRSHKRPMIKTIPPNSKIKMITLIKLVGKESSYTYEMVVNDVRYDLSMRKDTANLDLKIDNAISEKNVIMYSGNQCSFCNTLKTVLVENKIRFDNYNIDQNPKQMGKLIKHFEAQKLSLNIDLPILKIGNQLFPGIKTKEHLINILQSNF